MIESMLITIVFLSVVAAVLKLLNRYMLPSWNYWDALSWLILGSFIGVALSVGIGDDEESLKGMVSGSFALAMATIWAAARRRAAAQHESKPALGDSAEQ